MGGVVTPTRSPCLAQVQQGGGRFVSDTGVAVGRSGDHAFEQTQHRAHLRSGVQRGNKMHLRCARVGEANVDSPCDQAVDHCVGARSHSPMMAVQDRCNTAYAIVRFLSIALFGER
jgi:hypothetical protein